MPRSKPTTEALAARKEAILKAAGQVFLEQGFERAATLEIARRAKTSKRELYELFGSKQDLLAALIRSVSQRMETPLRLPAPNSRAAFFDILRGFAVKFLEELLTPTRVGLYRLAIAEAHRSPTVAQELEANGRAPVQAAVQDLFQQGEEKGYIKPGETSLMVRVFFGVLIGNWQTQLLLGLGAEPTAELIGERAATAASVIERMSPHQG
jgi:AcrR family transcriptional regulator